MRVTRSTGRAVLLLFMLVTGLLHAAPAAMVKIAILAGVGERAPDDKAIALLEVQLSQQEGVVLLERQDVDRVLREHEIGLSGAGLTDRATSVRVGKLLHVDCFLAVERVRYSDGGWHVLHRLQLIEGRTGLIVGSAYLPALRGETGARAAMQAVEPLLAAIALPDDQKRYVGFAGYHGEGPRADDAASLQDALGVLVARELSKTPGVMIVDREHLQELQKEEELTGVDMALALSSFLIEGQVRPHQGKDGSVMVHTVVHRLGDGNAFPVIETDCRAQYATECGRQIAERIAEQIQVAGRTAAADELDATKEAAWFSERASSMRRYGESTRALPLLESAYVLAPTPARALALADVLRGPRPEWRICLKTDLEPLSEDEKRSALQRLIRVFRLWQIWKRDNVARPPDKKARYTDAGGAGIHQLGTLWRQIRSDDPQLQALYAELRTLKEEARELELKRTADRATYVNFETQDICEMSDTGSQFVRQMKVLMEHCVTTPGNASSFGTWTLFQHITHYSIRFYIPERFCTPEGSRALFDWCEWIRSQPSPHAEFGGWYIEALLARHLDNTRFEHAADRFVDLYLESLQRYESHTHTLGAMRVTLSYSSRRTELYRRVFDGVLANLDQRGLMRWYNGRPWSWNRTLPLLGKDYHLKWVETALSQLPPLELQRYRLEYVQASVRATYDELRGERRKLLGEKSVSPEVSPFWTGYRVEPLVRPWVPNGDYRLELMKRDGDRLIFLWMSGGNVNTWRTMRASVSDLAGNVQWSSPEHRVAPKKKHSGMHDAVLQHDRLYVAAGGEGLLEFTAKTARPLSQEVGLPKTPLITLAVGGDSLFLGYASDYLCTMDFATRNVKELAYSRSALRRNELDGCRERFAVGCLLADPDRDRIWAVTHKPFGLWWISLESGALHKVNGTYSGQLSWHEGRMLVATGGSLFARDLDDDAKSFGVRLHGSRTRFHAPHVIMEHDVISAGLKPQYGGSRVDWSGENRVLGKGGLVLHKACVDDCFDFPLERDGKPVHADFLLKTSPDVVLVGTKDAKFWTITDLHKTFAEDETITRKQQEWQMFVQSQTNQLDAITVEASSHADAMKQNSFQPSGAVDGDATTCWATSTNNCQGAWIRFSLSTPVQPTSIRLVNGWIPGPKQLPMYLINHRAKTLALLTDTGERLLLDAEDHNDPQILKLDLTKPARTITLTVTDIYKAEVVNPDDPPWLNISEILFFEREESPSTPGLAAATSGTGVALSHDKQGDER